MQTAQCVIFAVLFLLGNSSYASEREDRHAARFDDWPMSESRPVGGSGRPVVAGAALALDEVLLSESVAPSRFDQKNVDIARLADGSFLMAWDDNRDGARKIYWQRLSSSGQAIGANVQVAGATNGNSYVEPIIKSDNLNRIYLYYRDRTSGIVYGSRFFADLSVDQTPFAVNDTSQNSFAGLFDVDVYPDGRAVAVWEDYSLGGSIIAARIIGSGGTFVTAPMMVNADGGSVSHWVPSVAVEPSAGFLVSWEDYRNGNADIFAQLYSGAGAMIGSNFALVPTPHNTAEQYAPHVAFLTSNRYVISWLDQRSGQEVYLHEYNTNSGLVGANTLVSGGDPLESAWDIDLAVAPDGPLLVSWASFGSLSRIMSVRFDLSMNPIGLPGVRNLSPDGQRWAPSARFLADSGYVLSWTEVISDNNDISLMAFDTLGTRLLPAEVTVNDDALGAVSSQPSLAIVTSWYNLVTYTDQRRDLGDIFLRAFSNALSPVHPSQRVNQDGAGVLQTQPSLAVNYENDALVLWVDSRVLGGLSGQRVFGRKANIYGLLTGNEFAISDSLQTAAKSNPGACSGINGNMLSVWLDKRSGNWQVYGRWLDTAYLPDGPEFLIGSGADIQTGSLNVACGMQGRWLVSWVDRGTETPTVGTRWYHSDKSEGGQYSYTPSISGTTLVSAVSEADGDAVGLLWTALDQDGFRVLYYSRLDFNGSEVQVPVAVTDDLSATPSNPTMAVDEVGRVTAAWVDRREGRPQVYMQLFESDLTPISGNQSVTAAGPELMQSPSAAMAHGRAYVAWADSRTNGMNIYAGLVVYDVTGIGDDDEPTLPNAFTLGQNYPNPFNPTTRISFSLPQATEVSLRIYNVLGQQVRTLVDNPMAAGTYTVTWDGATEIGSQAASGVYLYRLTAGEQILQKKMILMK
jgi:hypothetical protein